MAQIPRCVLTLESILKGPYKDHNHNLNADNEPYNLVPKRVRSFGPVTNGKQKDCMSKANYAEANYADHGG